MGVLPLKFFQYLVFKKLLSLLFIFQVVWMMKNNGYFINHLSFFLKSLK